MSPFSKIAFQRDVLILPVNETFLERHSPVPVTGTDSRFMSYVQNGFTSHFVNLHS